MRVEGRQERGKKKKKEERGKEEDRGTNCGVDFVAEGLWVGPSKARSSARRTRHRHHLFFFYNAHMPEEDFEVEKPNLDF